MYCKVVFDVPLDRDFDYAVPQELQEQVKPGVRVTAPFGRMLTTGLVVSTSEQTTLSHQVLIKEIACVLDKRPLFGADLFPLAQFMKQTWGGPIGQILFALVPPQAYFKLQEEDSVAPLPHTEEVSFTPDQTEIFNRLQEHMQMGFGRVLLDGGNVPSQTDIILQLARHTLQNYGQILITLPDVFAAQHFAYRLQTRFGENNVLCWHSKMLLSQKKKIFSRVSNGLPCVVVSARSGALLPFKNLRLAAILEEENDNYKQEENKPYFHLRDLLNFRCQQHEALLIHASDTPSLEILYAAQKGLVEVIHIPEEKHHLTMAITAKKSKKSPLFSDETLEGIELNLSAHQASLLLLNRRGYSNAYYCFNCGTYAKCKKCGAILSREKTAEHGDRLICKKCGQVESLDQTCPQCQNKIFKSRGGGTQKIVSELNRLFPTARVLRLDSDTLKNKDGQGYQIRRALENKQVDIVVGTRQALELVSSPHVTLAAIMDAELELDSPDFRASEKLGQLLFKLKNQLAPRPQAKLFIQTASADIYPFESLHQSYDACAHEELLARESFNYPPFIKMAKILLKGKDATLLEAETSRLMTIAAPYCLDILGPVKTGKKTDILKKQYLLCKATTEKYPALIGALDAVKPSKKTDFKLLPDPYDFY